MSTLLYYLPLFHLGVGIILFGGYSFVDAWVKKSKGYSFKSSPPERTQSLRVQGVPLKAKDTGTMV